MCDTTYTFLRPKKKAKKYGKNIRENLWEFAQKIFDSVVEVGGLLELCHISSVLK